MNEAHSTTVRRATFPLTADQTDGMLTVISDDKKNIQSQNR